MNQWITWILESIFFGCVGYLVGIYLYHTNKAAQAICDIRDMIASVEAEANDGRK